MLEDKATNNAATLAGHKLVFHDKLIKHWQGQTMSFERIFLSQQSEGVQESKCLL